MKDIKLKKSGGRKMSDLPAETQKRIQERTKAGRQWAEENRAELAAHALEVHACRELMQQVKGRREALGMSLGELAERVGIDKSNLSRLEQGKGNPTIATVAKVATALRARLAFVPEEAA